MTTIRPTIVTTASVQMQVMALVVWVMALPQAMVNKTMVLAMVTVMMLISLPHGQRLFMSWVIQRVLSAVAMLVLSTMVLPTR